MINGTVYQPRDLYNLTGNITATAQWVRCVVTYNDGYSTSGTIPGSTQGCSNVLANPGTLKRTNFYFSGWVVEGVLYQPGQAVTVTGNRTAYAQWKKYTLSFLDTNADSGSAPNDVFGAGNIISPKNIGTLVRNGYYISGWTVGGTNYAFGATINLNGDLTASPIWSRYTITFNSSAVYTGTMPSQTLGFGSTPLAAAPSIRRSGYSFAGWTINGVNYAVGANYNLTSNVTALARWVRN
jgi:hypothetical protein